MPQVVRRVAGVSNRLTQSQSGYPVLRAFCEGRVRDCRQPRIFVPNAHATRFRNEISANDTTLASAAPYPPLQKTQGRGTREGRVRDCRQPRILCRTLTPLDSETKFLPNDSTLASAASYPPLQKTQGRGTHSVMASAKIKSFSRFPLQPQDQNAIPRLMIPQNHPGEVGPSKSPLLAKPARSGAPFCCLAR